MSADMFSSMELEREPIEPLDDVLVGIYCTGFGYWHIPALHYLDRFVTQRLKRGWYEEFLEKLPKELETKLLNANGCDKARFFIAWIHACMDYEVAAWNEWAFTADKYDHLELEVPDEESEPEKQLINLVNAIDTIEEAILAMTEDDEE